MRSSILRPLVVLCLLSLLAPPGCASFEDLASAREDAVGIRDQLQGDLERLKELAARTPPEDPLSPEIQSQIEEVRAVHSLVAAGVERADHLLAEVQNPSDPLTQAVGLVAPWLPEPARTPALLAGALLAAVFRARQLRQALDSVARGFDRAMKDDPALAEGVKRNAPTLRASQTPLAQRAVDRVQAQSRRPAA